MGIAERSWCDSRENYADGWRKVLTASTADSVITTGDEVRPAVVYSITLSVSQNNASGDLSLVDGSASGDSGDTRKWSVQIASGATTDRNLGVIHADFPRGLVFDTGLIVSAATVTGHVAITYKMRY